MEIAFRPDPNSEFTQVVGIGGIGSGVAFSLLGEHTLGREESRLGTLLPNRDYCKLHIVEHYIAAMMGTKMVAAPFHVAAIGVVGNDAVGDRLLIEMENAGIDTQWVRKDLDRPTLFSICYIYPDGTGGNITASNSAASALNETDLQQGAERMRSLGSRCIALCLPEVPLDVRSRFLTLATQCGNFRVASLTMAEISPAQALNLFSSIDLLALNGEEASSLVGYKCTADNMQRFLMDCSSVLTAIQPTIQIVISAGGEGAYGFQNGVWSFCPAPHVSVASTAGAGDALLGGVLSGLSAGLPFTNSTQAKKSLTGAEIDSALELGVLLASFSVTSPDTIHFQANLSELEKFASSMEISFGNKIRRAIRESDKPSTSVL